MVALQELTDGDREWLRETIARHASFTGSPVAEALLADWTVAAGQFKRVMPIDYQRVLNVMEQAQADGLDEAATLDRVMEASRG
jgi:glutamate synthase (NADPH/NADH) large chain